MTSSGIVADIKSRLPIVELVGETVALKRAGSAYKGLCPFHAEKTPSFIVTPDRESWHCFGCGKGGDVFTFLMERDRVDFREALTRLAEKAGVELSAQSAREDRRRRRLREALEAAITWYREVLLRTPQGERARAYLRERGFSDETLDRFSIGYAPNVWDALSKRLGARGFSDEELVSAGLAGPSNRGGIIDKFRGRIVIPIRDQSGKAVGLGGRILPGLDGPKYLNSPSTPLFDKSRTLFAIDLAKSSIRKEKLSVIVEGYTDVMAAHQAGFTNVVASLGTALTAGQVALATKYADAVALAYDIDLAGEAASHRGLLEELAKADAVSKVRLIRIPAGKDPDELIRKEPETWRRLVADAQGPKARPVLQDFIERVAKESDLESIIGRREVTGRVLGVLKRVPDPVERNLYLLQLSQLVHVDERTLSQALERAPLVRRTARVAREPGNGTGAPAPSLGTLESEALELMLRYPTLAAGLPADEALPFAGAVARQLAAALHERALTMSAGDGQADPAAALETFVGGLDPATGAVARELLGAAALDSGEPTLDPVEAREVLRTCLLRLRVERLDEALRDGRLLLEEAQREGDHGRLEEIEQRIDGLGREKAEATREMHTPATSLA